MIKTIGNKERLISTIGAKENKVAPELVAKALGAEYLGSVGANTHNLPVPKQVEERLIDSNILKDQKEKTDELVASKAK